MITIDMGTDRAHITGIDRADEVIDLTTDMVDRLIEVNVALDGDLLRFSHMCKRKVI